jgi:hypothetical protein
VSAASARGIGQLRCGRLTGAIAGQPSASVARLPCSQGLLSAWTGPSAEAAEQSELWDPPTLNTDGLDSLYLRHVGGRPPNVHAATAVREQRVALSRPERDRPGSTWSLLRRISFLADAAAEPVLMARAWVFRAAGGRGDASAA